MTPASHTVGVTTRTVLLPLAVALGLVLTGCAPGATSGGSTTPSTTPSDTPAPDESVTPSPPAVSLPCTLNQDGVDISYLPGDGSMGHFHGTLRFINTGAQACLLEGFPMVYFGNPESAGPIGARSNNDGASTSPVVLAPAGGSATAAVTIANAGMAGVCEPVESSKLLVRLPDAPNVSYSEGIGWGRSVPIDPLPACLDNSITLITVGSVVAG